MRTKPSPGLGGRVPQKLVLIETPKGGSNGGPSSDLDVRCLQVPPSGVPVHTQGEKVSKQRWERVRCAVG